MRTSAIGFAIGLLCHAVSAGQTPEPRVSDADILNPFAVLEVSAVIHPAVERMWQSSATFRRQCARLAEAAVTVKVALEPGPTRRNAHAITTIDVRSSQVRSATTRLYSTAPQHLAHEIEHVLEQIDGIDLRRAAANHLHGVREAPPGQFETARAVAIGRLVASEMERQRAER